MGFWVACTDLSETVHLELADPRYSLTGARRLQRTRATKVKVLRYSRRGLQLAGVLSPPLDARPRASVCPVMTTRAEHLRQQARKVALKAAGAKELAMKGSLREEQKQLLMLAEQAEKDEQNRMGLPPRGLTKK